VIIVSYFTKTLDLMPKLLAKKSIEFVRVDGRVTGDERM